MSRSDAACEDIRRYEDAIEYLYQRINYEKTGHAPYSADHYRLDRMRSLLHHLGDPHLAAPVIHIAGTKGKGSTATLIASVMQGCGNRTGLMTSPHLMRLEERIRIDGAPCSANELVQLVDLTRTAAERVSAEGGGKPTFFELTTAMGFLHFARQNANVVVVEVGLGGRLDSTNVCQPELCIITTIGLDHQAQLGNTIAAIAGEKAGIIKARVPVVSSARHPDARQVILERAQSLQCNLRIISRDFDCRWEPIPFTNSPNFSVQLDHATDSSSTATHPVNRQGVASVDFLPKYATSHIGKSRWELSMLGEHQADNLAAVLAAVDCLAEKGWSFNKDSVRQAVFSTVVPARLQIVGLAPLRIIDTAHNSDSIHATLNALDVHFPNRKRFVLFASSRDKDTHSMIQQILPRCHQMLGTQYRINPRSLAVAELRELLEKSSEGSSPNETHSATGRRDNWELFDYPQLAWEAALDRASENDLICATGSFFLAAELLPMVKPMELEPNPSSRLLR